MTQKGLSFKVYLPGPPWTMAGSARDGEGVDESHRAAGRRSAQGSEDGGSGDLKLGFWGWRG